MNGEQRETARSKYAQKLTPRQVRRIRERYDAGGVSVAKLAQDYGMSRWAMYMIVQHRSWAWVDAPTAAHGSLTETR